jgi:hypothetical protein
MKKAERSSLLDLAVPDSGRTWSVLHHEIQRIPPDKLEAGDVLIVRHATEPGVMIMQVVSRRPGNEDLPGGWNLVELQLKK